MERVANENIIVYYICCGIILGTILFSPVLKSGDFKKIEELKNKSDHLKYTKNDEA